MSIRGTASARRKGKHENQGLPGGTNMPASTSRQSSTISGLATEESEVDAGSFQLLAEKQAELGAVIDRHDTLVRELFHLNHFTSMLNYNPEEAKLDDSKVFQQYKATYDLLEHAIPGPSRPTRGRLTEQRQLLQASSLSASTPVAPHKRKGKGKGKTRASVTGSPAPQIRLAVVGAQENGNQAISAETSMDSPLESITIVRKKPDDLNSRLPSPVAKKRRLNGDIVSPGFKRVSTRKSDRSAESSISALPFLPKENGVISSYQNLVGPPPPPGPNNGNESKSSCTPVLKHNIKRIRLLVRRPPPNLTNPQQRPPIPKYNSSLKAFLDSYTTPDGKTINKEALQQNMAADAAIFERAEVLRKQGRFFFDPEIISDLKANGFKSHSSFGQRATRDHWDNVIESIMLLRAKQTSGSYIAGQIAAKIRAYWDSQEAKKEKQRQQEEKNLRMLAKATIRMVTNEWKKAVFHIREQERLRRAAEERRRGHEHLDALLDQSGQLLETQHFDLSRGPRSRSNSLPHDFGWHSESDKDEDEDEETDTDADEGGMESDDVPHDVEVEVAATSAEDEFGGDEAEGEEEEEEEEDEIETRMLLMPDEVQVSTVDNIEMDGFDDKSSEQNLELDASSTIVQDEVTDMNLAHLWKQDTVDIAGDGDQSSVVEVSSPRTSLGPQTPFSEQDQDHLPNPLLSSCPVSPETTSLGLLTHVGSTQSILKDASDSLKEFGQSEITQVDFQAQIDDGRDTMDQTAPWKEIGEDDDHSGAIHKPVAEDQDQDDSENRSHLLIPHHLKPYAVAPVDFDPNAKIAPPLLLRGVLRPYQQSGLEWLASLHANNMNGILADEMGLGKTIQTIALLAHLACDRGIWGPHLIVVPTSVLLNWEMEFKKFLPGFKILSYHGNTKRRKELRQGWNDKHHFNVCITSYTLASRDAHIFKRKPWYYMILDEAHMIKNFKSQRWNILLMFRSFRRLLLTGTPLQNNLTELWALLQFLLSGAKFANLKEFEDWFSNPLEKAIEMGSTLDSETMQRVSKLHTVLRPYILRRLKKDVERELPSKFEHLVMCPLSKRQRFLYDEFMSRAHTRDALQSGIYQKIANILMQLRKVCNHPDLFEVRPIATSFAMDKSAFADLEIKELLVRRRFMDEEEQRVNLDVLGLRFIDGQNVSLTAALERRRLDATALLPFCSKVAGEPPPKDTRTIAGFRQYAAWLQRANDIARWSHIGYLNRLRCTVVPIYSSELLKFTTGSYQPILPVSALKTYRSTWERSILANSSVKSYEERADAIGAIIDRFAFALPPAVAVDIPRLILAGCDTILKDQPPEFDKPFHATSVKMRIAFPEPTLLQYDCGKLQELARLLREKKAGGHRALIFTQMTRILDILETFLNLHGYLYLRLDGATKIEDRQYITERFNADPRIFCFIASSRSGGVGINLTGADTVIFYDSDFNPQMDKQCEDRAHRIGQIRDVHIYRFVSQYTVEEALLRKANQKRSLNDIVIQKGEFDWRSLFNDQGALSKALEEFEDTEDAHAAAVAAREEIVMEGADEADFGGDLGEISGPAATQEIAESNTMAAAEEEQVPEAESESGEGGSVTDYMVLFVERDYDHFKDWRL